MKGLYLLFFCLFSFAAVCEAGEEIIKKDVARSSFREAYSLAQGHKAFAQSRQGAWAWASDKANAQDAVADAIAKCTKNLKDGESACIAIHVDDQWIAKDELQKNELAAELARAERGGILSLTNENIKHEIENSKGRLAVHFSSYDRGCGYCDVSNIPVEKLMADYRPAVRFARIAWQPWQNINPDIADNFKIRGLPTLIVFNDGKEEFRIGGWMPSLEKEIRSKFDACCKN